MKTIAIILAAGVLAGLLVYGIAEWNNLIFMNLNGMITMRIVTLVGIFAGVGFISAALALVFRRSFQHADSALTRRLEERIELLEASEARTTAPDPPADPAG